MNRRITEAALRDLIAQTYDAALEHDKWTNMAITIGQVFHAPSVSIQLRDTQQNSVDFLSLTDNLTSSALADYRDYYWRQDLWASGAARCGLSKVFIGEDFLPASDLERTEFYQDWCRAAGVYHVVGSVVPITEAEACTLGVHRPKANGIFDDGDKRMVAAYLPHLQRAIKIRQRLLDAEVTRVATFEAFARTGIATLVVSRDLRILYANAAAERLLTAGDGVRGQSGRLTTQDHLASQQLHVLVQSAAKSAGTLAEMAGGTMFVPRADRLPLSMMVAPFQPLRLQIGGTAPAALVMIRDPEAATPSDTMLQALYGFTRTEAVIARMIADGSSIEDIARRLAVSLNTARSHLKNIFLKTDTNRQGQLVSVLLRSLAGVIR